MARLARREYLDPKTIQIVHVTSRCVRRAFLCGDDPVTGKSFEHRREWIRKRLEVLASIFAIDCLTFAVLSNHFHLILRSRPDIVRGWSDQEVAERWLRLCPPRKNGVVVKVEPSDLELMINQPTLLGQLRERLSDVSWWMRLLGQKIAQQANREDQCTGRFWEGRYKAQLLLDEAAVLACAMYVDLNPIRAAMAESLEDSNFTGAKARIDDLKDAAIMDDRATSEPQPESDESKQIPTEFGFKTSRKRTSRWERSRGREQSGWLSPLEIKETSDPVGADPSPCGRRASLKGFLPVSLLRYLELLDWTGRQMRSEKRGAIPEEIAPILNRLGIQSNRWMDLAQQFGQLFKRAAGTSVTLSSEANRRGQNWLQAPGKGCFA
jgi:REP element-mobilizing transposase RayT